MRVYYLGPQDGHVPGLWSLGSLSQESLVNYHLSVTGLPWAVWNATIHSGVAQTFGVTQDLGVSPYHQQ